MFMLLVVETIFSKSLPCVFLRYSLSQCAYKCLDPSSGRVYFSRHVAFVANEFPFQTLVRNHSKNHNTPISTVSPPPILLPSLSPAPLQTHPNATQSPPLLGSLSPAQHVSPSLESSSSDSHELLSTVRCLAGATFPRMAHEITSENTVIAPVLAATALEPTAMVGEPVSSALVPQRAAVSSSS